MIPQSDQHSRISRWIPFSLFLVACALRMVVVFDGWDLEHDEALICLGALAISEQGVWPLTGDKVYEGPLLEYMTAVAFRLFGSTESAARLVMAFAGFFTIAALGMLAHRLMGSAAACAAMLLWAVFPWAVMTSRVIYAGNLVPLFTCLALYFGLRGEQKPGSFPVAFFCVGLAMQGHLYAGLLIGALLWLWLFFPAGVRRVRYRLMPLNLLALFIGYAPVAIYNLANGFPSLRIFFGSQGFVPPGGGSLPGVLAARWTGYLWSLHHALIGDLTWVDFYPLVERDFNGMFTLPLLFLLGIGFAIGSLHRWQGSRLLLGWSALIVLVVPLITKHREAVLVWGIGRFSPPHYLNLMMPLVILFACLPLADRVLAGRRTSIRLPVLILTILLCLTAAGEAIGMNFRLAKLFRQEGGVGRWRSGLNEVINEIRSDPPVAVVASYLFECGYPQLQFLLPEIPVYAGFGNQFPARVRAPSGTCLSGRVYYMYNSLFQGSPPAGETIFEAGRIPAGSGTYWRVYSFTTPSIDIRSGSEGEGMQIDVRMRGEEGEFRLLNREQGLLTGRLTGRQDRFGERLFWRGRTFVVSERHRSMPLELRERLVECQLEVIFEDGTPGTIRLLRNEDGWLFQVRLGETMTLETFLRDTDVIVR